MTDPQIELENARRVRLEIAEAIKAKGSDDIKLLMSYIDAKHSELAVEIRSDFANITQAYETAKGIGWTIKMLLGVSSAAAVIYAAIHGQRV